MEDNLHGLTSEQVAQRVANGQINHTTTLKTKSIRRIFYDNICTLFNFANILLFISLLLVGSYKNMLFIGVVFFNTIIGIIQEIRSKRSVDKLSILTESKVYWKRCRNGSFLLRSKDSGWKFFHPGSMTVIGEGINDELLSGSFISAGKCRAKVIRVGADCYAAKINNDAKYIKKNNSQILKSFKFIIKLCTIVLFPLGIILFSKQFFFQGADLQTAVVSTVAALVGIIAGGMILLTSSVLAVSIIRLSQKKVLVNEMYCIETLARVDTICLDKTGTLTADTMHVSGVVSLDCDEEDIKTALSSIYYASDDINATLEAIGGYIDGVKPVAVTAFTPFSSETKWSGGEFDNGMTYIMGAAEFVFSDKEKYKRVYDEISRLSETVRIIAVAYSSKPIVRGALPDDLTPMALVLIKDTLRDNVKYRA